MVKLLFLLGALGGAARGDFATRFVMECGKSRLYQGETTTCRFLLYASVDRLEVEVSKFPEFRGFWSENSAMRQGPLLLTPDSAKPGQLVTLIGSYHLTPMVGVDHPVVAPMRIVVRALGASQEDDQAIPSEIPKITVLPLPPVPKPYRGRFLGAVGQFALRPEASVFRFFPKEPTSVRYLLSGTGNFPDINALPLVLPEGVQKLSLQTSTMGNGAFQTKAFDVSLVVDSESGVELPSFDFVFFNPEIGRYQTLTANGVSLEPLPKVPETQMENEDWGHPEPYVPPHTPWIQTRAFFWVQVFLAVLWLGLWIRTLVQYIQLRRSRDPRVALRRRWRQLLGDASLEADRWLVEADDLVFATLRLRANVPLRTRREAIDFARRRWGNLIAQQVGDLFRTREQIQFSPSPPSPPARAQLLSILTPLRRLLLK